MQVQHAARGRPLEDRHICAAAEDGHHDSLQDQLELHGTIPRDEERIFVHELAALALAEARVILDALHARDDPDNLVPLITPGESFPARFAVSSSSWCTIDTARTPIWRSDSAVYPVACGLSRTYHFLALKAWKRWRKFIYQYMKVMCDCAHHPRLRRMCEPQVSSFGSLRT